MRLRLSILLLLLNGFTIAHAQEKLDIPIDLIELLGDMDSDDQTNLEAAMKEVNQTPAANKQQKSPVKTQAGERK
jgi:hypothetical protein